MKKGIVCSDLYSVNDSRTLKSNTFAMRNLVEGAIDEGLGIEAVVRFFPLVTRRGIFFPKKRVINDVVIFDVPKVGVKNIYSAMLTRLILWAVGFRGPYDYAICHMVSNFGAAERVLKGGVEKFFIVVHQSDFKNKHLHRSVREADGVFCRSFALSRKLEDELGEKCHGVLFSGIDKELIRKDDYYISEHRDEIVFIVACVFIPLKNVLSTISAYSRLKKEFANIRLEIYGDGPQKSAIQALLKELCLNEHVHLHGFRPQSEVFRAMLKANVFIMPSAPETFGLAYLEAMAAGCVVIGHKGWGVDGIIKDGVNGYLVGVPTPEQIYIKMLHYMQNNERHSMHEKSLNTSKKYTNQKAFKNYKRLIESLL